MSCDSLYSASLSHGAVLSIDLRDAVGDRLFLSGSGLRRDGVSLPCSFFHSVRSLQVDPLRCCSSYKASVCLVLGAFDT